MKKLFIVFTILAILMSCSGFVYATATFAEEEELDVEGKISELEKSIDDLVLELQNMSLRFDDTLDNSEQDNNESLFELKDEMYEIIYSQEKEISELRKILSKQTAEIEVSNSEVQLFIKASIAFLTFVGLGSISGYVSIKNSIEDKIREKYEGIIEQILRRDADQLIALTKSLDIEEQLRAKKKILVLSNENASSNFVNKVFLAFNNVKYKGINDDFSHEDFDLIVFDNEDGSVKPDEFNKHVKENSCVYLYFALKGGRFDPALKSNLNFSNSKSTLFNQLMNSLRLHETLNI